jgi:hypothetical protein
MLFGPIVGTVPYDVEGTKIPLALVMFQPGPDKVQMALGEMGFMVVCMRPTDIL